MSSQHCTQCAWLRSCCVCCSIRINQYTEFSVKSSLKNVQIKNADKQEKRKRVLIRKRLKKQEMLSEKHEVKKIKREMWIKKVGAWNNQKGQ